MSVSLVKGSKVNLEKISEELGIESLTHVGIGLGWDVNSSGMFGRSFDLDAWVLTVNQKKLNEVTPKLVYYWNKTAFKKAILHMGDNLTGAGDGDDETIKIDLTQIPENYDTIIIGVTIYCAKSKGQSFKDIKNTFIRIYSDIDKHNQPEICKYSDTFIDNCEAYATMIFGMLVRTQYGWIFKTIGSGIDIDSITAVKNINIINSILEKEKKNMAVSLSKGGKVSLAKAAADAGVTSLKAVGVGLGWDTNRYDGGDQFDLDASAFLQGANRKVRRDTDFIFYNNLIANGVEHTGDNRTGDGEGDDELIKITLDQVDPDVDYISFTVTIDKAAERHQNFGMVENAYIRIFDLETGTEIIRYDLSEDYSIQTALVVGELYRKDGDWKFNAIGSGYEDGLKGICGQFRIDAE